MKNNDTFSNDFVLVEGGTFNNGTADVTLSSFHINKYEVTQAEYERVIGENPSYFKGDNLPVESVSWYDAVEFCNKKSKDDGLDPCYFCSGKNIECNFTANGYRLPTEMEWMFAAKGGNGEPATGYNEYAGTDVEAQLTNYAWYDLLSGQTTYTVGTKLPNELGLYDMSGNVWEWCNDWYGAYKTNPTGVKTGSYRVIRGGSWGGSATYCRVASLIIIYPSNSYITLGFRLVRSL